MKELRPISFCNVSYNIISKFLSQQLKKLLPKLVSEIQFAFVVGQVISDNFQDAFHALVTNDKWRKEFMAVKTT